MSLLSLWADAAKMAVSAHSVVSHLCAPALYRHGLQAQFHPLDVSPFE